MRMDKSSARFLSLSRSITRSFRPQVSPVKRLLASSSMALSLILIRDNDSFWAS
jgi:hypothetical protein